MALCREALASSLVPSSATRPIVTLPNFWAKCSDWRNRSATLYFAAEDEAWY